MKNEYSYKSRKFADCLSLLIFLTLALPFSAGAEVSPETRAKGEQNLRALPDQFMGGPDLHCDLKNTFRFYKFSYKGVEGTPELCNSVAQFEAHFSQRILPYWPFKENFGMVVKTISSINEYNAAVVFRPVINKNTLPAFQFRFLPGTPLSPQQAVWSHEAGHAALQEILEDHFYPMAKERFLMILENAYRMSPLQMRLDSLEKQRNELKLRSVGLTEQESAKIDKALDAVAFRITALNSERAGEDPLNSRILPAFHEFWADLFAADLHRDPNIIGDAFDKLGLTTTPSDYRRFTPKNIQNVQGWSNRQPHILFTPARHYFGKYMASKVKDKKHFLRELALYFIKVLESPDPDFMSYQQIASEIQQSETPAAVSNVILLRQKKSELFTWISAVQIKNFCELDFKACKEEIIQQLNRGQYGLFTVVANPELANQQLINAMEQISKTID